MNRKRERLSSANYILVIILIMLIMLMSLPISIASSYTFLLADDWYEGVSKVDVTFGELIMLAIVNVKTYYLNWLGTYSAKFFQALLNPLNGFGSIQLRIIMTIVSLLFFVSFVVFSYYSIKKKNINSITSLLYILTCLVGMMGYKIWEETFYWYSGAICFTLPLSAFFLVASMINSDKFEKTWEYVLEALLLFVIVGGNLAVTGVVCWIMTVIIYEKYIQKKNVKPYIVVWIVTVTGALINTLAPGNYVRHGEIDDSGIHVFQSLVWSINYVIESTEWILFETPFGIMIMIITLIVAIQSRDKIKHSIQCVLLYAVTPIFAAFPVCLGYSRETVTNRCEFVIVCSIVIAMLHISLIVGQSLGRFISYESIRGTIGGLVILFILLMVQKPEWRITNTIPYKTVVDLSSNRIQDYYSFVNNTYSLIEMDNNRNVFLYDDMTPPDSFWSVGLTSDPENYINQTCARYFDKESIQCVYSPVYEGDEKKYIRLAPTAFDISSQYVSVVKSGTYGVENVLMLESFSENLVIEVPKDEMGKVGVYIFDSADGQNCINEYEIEF